MRFSTCVIVGVVLFLAQAFAFGQEPEQPTRAVPQDQCVRITVEDGDGNNSLGSGALIRDNLIATCNHVVKDRATDKVTVTFPGHGDISGKVIGVDKDFDIAIIALSENPPCEPLDVRFDLNNDSLSVQGYGSGKYKQSWGSLSRVIATSTNGKGAWRRVDDTVALSGDSGGPILNEDGEFVGTLWGSVGSATYFTPAMEVFRLLESLLCYNESLDMFAARYHTRGRVERFFKRGTELAARYHSRGRVNRFFKRATTRKAVA